MRVPKNTELESDLRKIAEYIVTLRQEIAALQANEMHTEKIPSAARNWPRS